MNSLLQRFSIFCLTAFAAIALFIFPPSAEAASSAAVRSFDDVKVAGTDFAGQDLHEAEFANETLQGANFSEANLSFAVFNATDLREANWHGVNFANGMAYLSNFNGADLTDGIFTDALFLQSVFDKNTNITDADFTNASIDRFQVSKLCDIASGQNSQTGASTRESLGCK
ncbi:MAG: pentapeptide repeat-containing protein [Cyanobacteria bacterium J06641_5]